MKYQRIQCLRGFAAIAVVLFHSFGTCQKYFDGSSRFKALSHGDYGVDLFFVISGFIIFTTASQRELDWRNFLKRRLTRIVPLYWALSVCMFAIMSIEHKSALNISNFAFLLYSLSYLSWFTGKLPVIYPGWTLEYEMAFYLLVSTAMFLRFRTWPFVIGAITLCVLSGIVAEHFGVASPRFVFLTNPMYVEFALGVLAAHLVLRRPLPLLATVGLAAVVMAIACDPSDERKWRLLVAGLPAALVVLYAARRDQCTRLVLLPSRLLVRLGDASYSIYLIQVFVISIACKALVATVPGLSVDAAIVIVSLATLLVAYGVHLSVELPMTLWLHRGDRFRSLKLSPGVDRVFVADGRYPSPAMNSQMNHRS